MSKGKKLSLRRLLKRAKSDGITFVPLQDDHVPGLYAGYKLGAFKDYGAPKDLSPLEFPGILSDISVHADLYACADENDRPYALIAITRLAVPPAVHIFWMPWTSDRQKVALGVAGFAGTAHKVKLTTTVKESVAPYFNRLCRYGILRKVGTLEDVYPKEEISTGHFYQAKFVDTPLITRVEL